MLGQAMLQQIASRLAYLSAQRLAVVVYRDPRSAFGLWDVHFTWMASCTQGLVENSTVDLASLSDALTILVSRLYTWFRPFSRLCDLGKMQSEGSQVRASLQGRAEP